MSDSVIMLAGDPCKLTYDKGALFRLDEVGVWAEVEGSLGFARAAKFVWGMMPAALRAKYPTPEAVAEVMPPVVEVWPKIDAALKAGGEPMSPKNVFGSTNGPTPSSSSTSAAKKPSKN